MGHLVFDLLVISQIFLNFSKPKKLSKVFPGGFKWNLAYLAFLGYFCVHWWIKTGNAEYVNKSVLTSKKFSPKLKKTTFFDKMGEQGPGFVGIRFCQVRIRFAHRF